MGKRKIPGDPVDPDWYIPPTGSAPDFGVHGHDLTPVNLQAALESLFGDELQLASFAPPRETRWRFRTWPWNHPDRPDDGAGGYWEEKPKHPRSVPVTVLTLLPDEVRRIRDLDRRALDARRQFREGDPT